MRFLALLASILLVVLIGPVGAVQSGAPLRLGVLALDGSESARNRWQATADHLKSALGDRDVLLVPLSYGQVPAAAGNGEIDLVIGNPVLQVDLEARFGAHRLATLRRLIVGQPYTQFGGVLFTRARRVTVETLEDLRGLRLAAVDRDSLSGFLAARRELEALGITPYSDLMVRFEGSHEAVVEAVTAGESDVGVIRTGMLETLAAQGRLDLDEIRVLASPQSPPEFPLRLSTPLYPEWAIAALPHLDHSRTQRIAEILLAIDRDSPAARTAGIDGWSPPANYRAVHELMRQLKLAPYTGDNERPLQSYLADHVGWIIALVLPYLVIAYTAGRAIRDNRHLTSNQNELLETMYKAEEAQRELMHRMQQLYDSERRFTALAESAPDPIVMVDDQGRVQFWNPAAEQVFGYSAAEMRGRNLHEALAPPELHKLAEQNMPAFSATGKGGKIGTNRELPALHKNGGIIPIELSLAAVQNQGRWSAIGVMRDITERKRYQAQLEQQIERADLFFNQGGVLMVILDEHGCIRRINATALEVIGLDEDAALGLPWFDLIVAPGDRARLRSAFGRAVRGDIDAFERDTSQILVREGDQQRWIAWHNVVLPVEHHPDRVLCTGLDVTGNLSLKRELESTRASFSNVVLRNRTGILVLDGEGRIEFSNPAAQRSLGRTAEQLRRFNFGVPSLQGGSELQIQLPDGRPGIAEVTASQTEWNNRPGYLVMIQDVTDRKAAEERAQYQAQHDMLTGLPNRVLLVDRLDSALARAERSGQGLAVLFLDLDRFKHINDTMGHRVGDQLLQAVAQRLQGHLRESDTVARLGGDEFVVLLEGIDQLDTARAVAIKIRTSFDEPLVAGDNQIFTKPSIGIAGYPEHGRMSDTLMRLADAAMYHAKRRSTTGVSVYTPEMSLESDDDPDRAKPLLQALERRQFELHFQPQFRLGDETPIGFEALLRWRHPEQGLVPPDQFIGVLENTGLIRRVGDWVIDQVLAQIDEWRRHGLPELPVAINVSMLQLDDPEFVERLQTLLAQAEVRPQLLRLELTERTLMQSIDAAHEILTRLQALGVGLHLDDFGTGYSSLALFERLPFDTIKIDRAFVAGLPGDARKAALVEATIGLARRLGLATLAEGVETPEQARFLDDAGCDLAQGFLFAHPMPADDILTWLGNQHAAGVRVHS